MTVLPQGETALVATKEATAEVTKEVTKEAEPISVSYTHLTLPTILRV